MADNEDSSVLFSLKELMSLEEDRIKSEEDDRVRSQQEVERARLDAERSAREAEQARISAEAERRRQEEQRVREEQARLEAIRDAEIEKARAETEQRARMEEIARQQEHERQLTALKQDQGKASLRKLLIGMCVGVVVVMGGLGFVLYRNHEDAQHQKILADERERKLRDEKEAAEKKAAGLEREQKELQDQLSSATDPEEKKRLEAKIAALEKEKGAGPNTAGVRATTGAGPATGTSPTKSRKCKPGDPLCSDLE